MAGPESTSDKPKPDAAKSAASGGDATSYVGSPAVGTSKAVAAAGVAAIGPDVSQVNERRRRLVWCAVTGFLGAWFIAFLRFFLPRTLFEPPTIFKIGYPSDYALGVDTKWQQKFRIWVVTASGPPFRHLRSLHAPGLYARLESQRKQIQVSVSRQRLRQRRREFRRTRSAADGPRARGTWLPTGRSSWMFPGCISGPRVSQVISTILDHFCLDKREQGACLKRKTRTARMARRRA